jgi:dipeptidase
VSEGRVLFGKNSDREPGEAQAVELVPSRTGLSGRVRCTHLEVPQVERTRAVALSRPAWMWGCEMGANDAGVVGGNEAVFTRLPVARVGLTGMDLLRLALERAGSAREAAQVVIELLARHPQGGGMGFRFASVRYHSSFLFADAREAWVLETAGQLWALERVRTVRTLSNALSISVPDALHPGAAAEARRRGFIARGAELDFARAFGSRLYLGLTGAGARQPRTAETLRGATGAEQVMATLRDHCGRHPAAGLRLTAPCAHASWQPTRLGGQTTGSMVSVLERKGARHFFTGTSSPCLSIFKPVSFDLEPKALGGGAPVRDDPQSLWWRHERLHRAVLESWAERHALVDSERGAIEKRAMTAANPAEPWREHREALPAWVDRHGTARRGEAAHPLFRAWWRRQAARDFA